MNRTIWQFDLQQEIGRIHNDIYGGFVEHMGRNVYGGVFDPGAACADEDGFRTDVLKLVREIDMPVTRYPGGSYSTLYNWEDSIGAQSERRVRREIVWRQLEPGIFGLDEFMRWARKAQTQPMLTVNIFEHPPQNTEALFEYCNLPGGTFWSDRRRANGAEDPYAVHCWCLGNELYGEWEIGEMNAVDYAKCAREHAKALRRCDPDCVLIVCGKPDDPEWNRTVLMTCGKYVDCLSLHEVFSPAGLSKDEYLRLPDLFGRHIAAAAAICREVEAVLPQCRALSISVDEWIVWDRDARGRADEEWCCGRHLLEQDYTIFEALIAGELFSVFHQYADIIRFACVAQTVNVLAPIRTEADGIWTQSTFHPFRLCSRYGRGRALEIHTENADDDMIVGSVAADDDGGLTVFAINRSSSACALELRSPNLGTVECGYFIANPDHEVTNSSGKEFFAPQNLAPAELGTGYVIVNVEPYSWNMLHFAAQTR